MTEITKGSTVTFTGFVGGESERPKNAALLEEGETYVVEDISDDDADDVAYFLAAANPDFDDTKRASKKANPKTLLVDVFEDEIELVAAEADEAEEQEELDLEDDEVVAEDEEDEEEEEDEEAPVAAAPAKASKKTSKKTAKKTAKKKAKSKAKGKAAPVEAVAYTPEGDLELTDEQQSADVMALIKGKTASQMIRVAQEHAREAMLKDWTLGGILYNVKTSGAYKKVQDKQYDRKGGWDAFVDEQLGLAYRKAQYLIDVYAKFTRFGIGGDTAARLGWSKASRISGVMNQDNAEELVEIAEDSSFRDLEETVKEFKTTKGAETGVRIKKLGFRFRIAEEGGVILNDYLEQARNELGHDNLDDTFQHIVSEWAQEHLNLKKGKAKGKGRGSRTTAKATGNGKTEQHASA